MKVLTILAAFIVSIVLLSSASNVTRDVSAQGKKPPETIVLGTDAKPKLLSEIPQVKFEGSAEPTVMTNQQAFHRNCGGCHDEVVKARPNLDPAPPTSKKCTTCHKKAAA